MQLELISTTHGKQVMLNSNLVGWLCATTNGNVSAIPAGNSGWDKAILLTEQDALDYVKECLEEGL